MNAARAAWFGIIAALLPGDRIHDVAPISKRSSANAPEAMSAIHAAQMKRLRRAKKRAA